MPVLGLATTIRPSSLPTIALRLDSSSFQKSTSEAVEI
jgi:hypothetical protein